MATIAPQISATGIVAPSFADIYAELQLQYWAIFGSDAVLTPDSQDGQWLAIVARAIYDTGQTAVAIYNAFSPATAQGDNLSSVVKINGIQRLIASKSQVTITVVGTAGTQIVNGLVGDNLNLGTQWALPALVTIPGGGTVDVIAQATVAGAVAGAAGTLTSILTPTRGWQTATNALDATLGAPVETDAALRQRQAASTALPAESVIGGIYAAVANLPNVSRAMAYDNDTGAPDANGIPAHSIAVVVDGGDAQTIANTIAAKKTPGTGTAGTTTETVVDPHGIVSTINFYPLTPVRIGVEVTIKALTGYASSTDQAIIDAVAAFVSAYAIGEDSYTSRLNIPANLNGVDLGTTFAVTLMRQKKNAGSFGTADIVIAFNEATFCDPDTDVTVIVT